MWSPSSRLRGRPDSSCSGLRLRLNDIESSVLPRSLTAAITMGGQPMRTSQSNTPETPARPDEPVEPRAGFPQILGNAEIGNELFEQAPEAVAVLTTDDRIVRVNKEFTRMFGYEPDEVLQRPINDLIVPEAQLGGARAYTRLLQQGGRVEVETVRRCKDGKIGRANV